MLKYGRVIFSLANIAMGVETIACAQSSLSVNGYIVIPILPFMPPIAGLAYLMGAIWAALGIGLLWNRSMRPSALGLGGMLFTCALLFDLSNYCAHLGNMSLRTQLFETLALAALAWLLPGPNGMPETPYWLAQTSRWMLALSLVVFSIDHFLALVGIGTLLPAWIPWHVFWVAFFGLVFLAAGVSIVLKRGQRWTLAGLGLMFAIWVFTLHLPRVLGLYGIPGAPRHPAEWSSLFVAIALWGGPWALAGEPKTGSD